MTRYFKKLDRLPRQVPGCAPWYLWMPVKRFLGIFWIQSGELMWLDDYGFRHVRGNLYQYGD